MAEHRIRLNWTDGDRPFTYETYPREHTIAYKNGQQVVCRAAKRYLVAKSVSRCHVQRNRNRE